MDIISIISLSVLCLLMAVLYMFYGEKTSWQAILVRGLAIFSCIALLQILASLKNISNALSLFLTLGFSLLLVYEILKFAVIESEKAKYIISTVLYSISLLLIAFGGLSVCEFNIFSLVGGIAFGIAIGFIICSIKKYKSPYKIFSETFSFIAIGCNLGFGLMGIIASNHIVSAICILGGGLIFFLQKILYIFSNSRKLTIGISNFLYIFALILISLSVYFY